MSKQDNQELRDRLRALPRTTKADFRYPIDAYEDDLVQLIDQYAYEYAERVIGNNTELITPEKYNELHPRRSFKADAAVHYENKAIAANNSLRDEQRKLNKELSSHREEERTQDESN